MQWFIHPLENLVNQALRLDPPSLQAMGQLSGKIIQVDIQGLGIVLTLLPEAEGIVFLEDYQGEVDSLISGAPFTLLRLLLQHEAVLDVHSGVTLRGEISTAQQFFNILHRLNIDWEEQASRWLGDIPAHALGKYFRYFRNYTTQQLHTLQLNTREYLQEESQIFPTHLEVEVFLEAIDILRDDVERLEQRIQRLEKGR